MLFAKLCTKPVEQRPKLVHSFNSSQLIGMFLKSAKLLVDRNVAFRKASQTDSVSTSRTMSQETMSSRRGLDVVDLVI